MISKIELLAPGGDTLSVKAAILAGADAVYLGVGEFNARKRAINISLKDLNELCVIAHQNNCKIYLTYNALAFEDEFQTLMDFLAQTIMSGIDAVIIQDYGLLDVAHFLFPHLEIHGSTQMTTHNRGQLKFLSPHGVKTINLSRELSLSEIKDLATKAHEESLHVEVFVHGAYCVSFSGQCYISGALCENSANRGACVQPCRRDYTLEKSTDNQRIRPMNLKDNSLFSSAGDLIDIGVNSLKIEGRIKGFEYVYHTVSAWREQINRLNQKGVQNESDARLTSVFNRSFSDNLIKSHIAIDSFTADTNDKSLSQIASVVEYHHDAGELSITSDKKISSGQIITIRSGNGQFICTGTLIEKKRNDVYLFQIEHKLMGKILKGQQIWAQPQIIDSKNLLLDIQSLSAPERKHSLSFTISGDVGEPLTLTAEALGKKYTLTSELPLEKASTSPTSAKKVEEQLAKLGNTPFKLKSCDLFGLSENLFIPVKLINELRRQTIAKLNPKLEIPHLKPSVLPQRKRIAVVVANKTHLKQIPGGNSIVTLFQLPADPEVLDEIIPLFDEYPDLIPWFPSILIGPQFDAACNFLKHSGIKQIVTDNSGIAQLAKENNINWIAGPLLNGTNGYALKLFQKSGAMGAFTSTELSSLQYQNITIPEGIELWSPLSAPTFLMKSRHCLIRNCIDCGKSVMDEHCLPTCSRSATIIDSQQHSLLIVKNRGDFNCMYNNSLRLFSDRINDSRIGTYLLDFRVPHKSLLPECSIEKFISLAQNAVEGNFKSIKQMENYISNRDTSEICGLDPLRDK
ncbi:MAG: U32 family peptidase [Spirochaetaceae bacterium]|jgi:putative protease|nr:U32 family peptidase [Spirochaetaceae bacterium]